MAYTVLSNAEGDDEDDERRYEEMPSLLRAGLNAWTADRALVVRGSPGMGKSTAYLHLVGHGNRSEPSKAEQTVVSSWLDWSSRIVRTPQDLRHVAISLGLMIAIALSPLVVGIGVAVGVAGASTVAKWMAIGVGALTVVGGLVAAARRLLARGERDDGQQTPELGVPDAA